FNDAIEVKGTITDISGSPLSGVTVSEKNSNNTTISDNKGHFSINVSKQNAILQFSVVGYQMQEVFLKGKSTLTVQMVPLQNTLDEVVVVGYGTHEKSLLTGTTSNAFHHPNLQGRVAGVSIRGNRWPGNEKKAPKYEYR